MRSRPILFNGAMVRAILEGRKTQTRRLVKRTALELLAPEMFTPAYVAHPANAFCPYGNPGDRLWVKETWNSSRQWMDRKPTAIPEGAPIFYGADFSPLQYKTCSPWHPSLFMRRWMSRITLEVTAVRVERLQDISEADALAEGVTLKQFRIPNTDATTPEVPSNAYRALWESINGPRSWAVNPWVWVVEFKRVEVQS